MNPDYPDYARIDRALTKADRNVRISIALVVLAAAIMLFNAVRFEPHVGRYQFHVGDGFMVRMDSTTGQTWMESFSDREFRWVPVPEAVK